MGPSLFHNKVLCNAILAGVVGIEPTLTVLETGVLPLYDTPILSELSHRDMIINYEAQN